MTTTTTAPRHMGKNKATQGLAYPLEFRLPQE